MAYHSFLDANYLIDCSDLPKDEKDKEKEKLLDARKEVLGKVLKTNPHGRNENSNGAFLWGFPANKSNL